MPDSLRDPEAKLKTHTFPDPVATLRVPSVAEEHEQHEEYIIEQRLVKRNTNTSMIIALSSMQCILNRLLAQLTKPALGGWRYY